MNLNSEADPLRLQVKNKAALPAKKTQGTQTAALPFSFLQEIAIKVGSLSLPPTHWRLRAP